MSAYELRRRRAVNAVRVANLLTLHKLTKQQIIEMLLSQSGEEVTERTVDRILEDLGQFFGIRETQKNARRPKVYSLGGLHDRRAANEWNKLCWAAPVLLLGEKNLFGDIYENDDYSKYGFDKVQIPNDSPYFSKTEREMFSLCRIRWFTVKEAAAKLGVSKERVQKLIVLLREKCVVSSAESEVDDLDCAGFLPCTYDVYCQPEVIGMFCAFSYHQNSSGVVSIYDNENFQMEDAKLSTTRGKDRVNPRWIVTLIDACASGHKVMLTTSDGQRYKVGIGHFDFDGDRWEFGNDCGCNEETPMVEGIARVEICE